MHDLPLHQPLQLAELLAGRLCHDLAGTVTTVTGMLKLGRDDPRFAEEALKEANEAALMMSRRLRLFRAAWGGAGDAISSADLAVLCDGLPGNRLQVDLAGLAAGVFPPEPARLVLNVLLLAAGSLRFGGTVALTGDPGEAVVARIDGPRAAWPPGLAGGLADPEASWRSLADTGPNGLQAAIIGLIARQAGLRISLLLAAEAEAAPPLLIRLISG